jgi:N-acetylglucosamine malate deacetylase 1
MSIRKKTLHVMLIVAHPDDAEGIAGGTAFLYRQMGHNVKFLSTTNGDTGHYEMGGGQLARRRMKEAQAAAAVIAAECTVLDIHNNELEPCLYYRQRLVEEIRNFSADIIITHRLNDYHPDHRYTSQLVQDAAGSAHLPNVCPLTPELSQKPAIVYAYDNFQKPLPFSPDIVVDIDSAMETKLEMWHCHTSQMYEWLPYEGGRGILNKVPRTEKARKKWLAEWRTEKHKLIADKFRNKLCELYGNKKGQKIKYAEAFEFSEYGTRLNKENWSAFFPFIRKHK